MPSQITNQDTQVNTYEVGEQANSHVAALSDGGYVIVWRSAGQDGDGFGIYGQRYDADGQPVGNEFQVNSNSIGDQTEQSVTATASGGFVVAWKSSVGDGDGDSIHAQVFDANGLLVGSEIQVNTYTTNHQRIPDVLGLDDGDFIVFWASLGQDGSSDGIYGQRFNADGSTDGNEFQVSTSTTGAQYGPSSAVLADGSYVVTWQANNQDGSDHGIAAQHFAADGSKIGGEITVNTYSAGQQRRPEVAALDNGNYVIVWHSEGQDNADGELGVYGQIFDDQDQPVGSEFRVNTTTAGEQASPSITALSDGGFIVQWRTDQDGDFNPHAQRFDADGNMVGTEFNLNVNTAGWQDNWRGEAITTLSDGTIVTSWHDDSVDGDSLGITARMIDPQLLGQLSGMVNPDAPPVVADPNSEHQINTYEVGNQTFSQVTELSDGGYVIAWNSEGQDGDGSGVYAQRYDADGQPVGNEFRVHTNTAGDQYLSAIEGTSDGGYLIAWMDTSSGEEAFFIKRFDASGNPVGAITPIDYIDRDYTNPVDTQASISLDVQPLADGTFLVMWGQNQTYFYQSYDAAGVATGSAVTIDTAPVEDDNNYAVKSAILPGGDVIFTYVTKTTASDWEIYTKTLDVTVGTLSSATSVTSFSNINYRPQISVLADGGYVVVWNNYGADSDGYGVYGQLFDAGGTKVGSEFQVNTTVTGNQNEPKVTALADGGFLVQWNSSDTDSFGQYAQRFDSSGFVVGGEFLVNETEPGLQFSWYQDTLVTLSNGNVVSTWQSENVDGDGNAIMARQLDTFISGDTIGTVAEDDDPDSDGLLEISGTLVATEIGNVAGSFNFGTIAGSYGSLTIDAGGNWDYEADNAQLAIQSLGEGIELTEIFTVSTADGVDQEVTITIHGLNDAPVAGDVDLGSTAEDTPLIITEAQLLAASSDVDGDSLSITNVTVPVLQGSIVDNGDSTWTYTPREDYWVNGFGMQFTVSDGSLSDTAQAILEVTPVNDAPVVGDVDLGSTAEDTPLIITEAQLLAASSDVDGDSLSITNVTVPVLQGNITDNGDSTWTYTPTANFWSDDFALSFTVSDGSLSDTALAILDVTPVNDAAVIGGDVVDAVTEDVDPDADGNLEVSGALTISDIDSGAEQNFVASTQVGLYGTLTIDAGGSWDYVADNMHPAIQALALGESLTDTMTVTSVDGTIQDITITINGAGSSEIYGTEGPDSLVGTFDAEIITGLGGNDSLVGGDGEDALYGNAGSDIISGGEGNDYIEGGTGADQLLGEGGDDKLIAGGDADTLAGGEGKDTLYGGGDADSLSGGSGNDVLFGGDGADTLNGGDASDYVRYQGSASGVSVNLDTGAASGGDAQGDVFISIENLYGSEHNDSLTGDNSHNALYGDSGNDLLQGLNGEDYIAGQNGNDTLLGGDGADLLEGGSGIDSLDGGTGNDTLSGGSGSDAFVFDVGWDDDVVTDFDAAGEVLDLSATGLTYASLTITQSGSDTLIEDGLGNSILLQGVATTEISQTDFSF